MSILSKLVTVLRGGMNEAGEAVIDRQALRILDQEIRDSSAELSKSKDGLATIIAQQKIAEGNVNQFAVEIEKNEKYVIAALEKGDNALAEELAQRVASFENKMAAETETVREFSAHADSLRESIKLAEMQVKKLKNQTEAVKATEAVQKAQEMVAVRHHGNNSKLRTAIDSLDRIKEKQKQNSAKMQAYSEIANDLGEDSLDAKLVKAGIEGSGVSSSDVLSRLQNKSQES